jgi:hypothetical protein
MGELLNDIQCNAPGRMKVYRKKICGKRPAFGKITQRMVGRIPEGQQRLPQPKHLCLKHWDEYDEVNALSGELKPKRPWPGKKK